MPQGVRQYSALVRGLLLYRQCGNRRGGDSLVGEWVGVESCYSTGSAAIEEAEKGVGLHHSEHRPPPLQWIEASVLAATREHHFRSGGLLMQRRHQH